MFTHDTSRTDVRFVIRGYFDGMGKHWVRIWDRELGRFGDVWCKDSREAESYLRSLGVMPAT